MVTVLAGAPTKNHEGYNSKTTGASFAPDAIGIRRAEDARAMSQLGANFVWLELFDNDYLEVNHGGRDEGEILEAIRRVLDDVAPRSVLSPLGLVHSDHLAVSNASLELAREFSSDWYLYMDMPYGQAMRETVPERIRDVERATALEALEPFVGNAAIKRSAMRTYASQYGPTKRAHRRGFRSAMKEAERYWKVV